MADYIKDIREKIGHDMIFMPAAGAILYKDGKILLQQRQDNGKWAIHGGAMELGETFLQTLERELREEIGIKPISPELLGIYSGKDLFHEYPNGDKVSGVTTIFLVETYEGELREDKTEVKNLKWFNIENLPKELHIPDIRPIKDLQRFLKNRKIIID